MKFELTLLGTSGAVPAYGRFPTMQILNVQESLYMIDCGEGAQMRFSDYNVRWGRLKHIFISHLHGDHFYGLLGLISSMGLNGRSDELTIFCPPGLEAMLTAMMPYMEKLSFGLNFQPVPQEKHEMIYEDKHVQVFTLPLRHSIPAAGFIFRERERPRSMRGELIEQYGIPYQQIPDIKAGADFVTGDGQRIPNHFLTTPPPSPRSYAYCSDTTYLESLIPLIQGSDLLYHEATFGERERAQAYETRHSTATDAARIAKEAAVGQLVLGHYSSRYRYLDRLLAEACQIFPNTLLGVDGGIVSVPLR